MKASPMSESQVLTKYQYTVEATLFFNLMIIVGQITGYLLYYASYITITIPLSLFK
ncbi:hypothetical protein Hanom_Chr06g00544451 [Helianthus anomalus]